MLDAVEHAHDLTYLQFFLASSGQSNHIFPAAFPTFVLEPETVQTT